MLTVLLFRAGARPSLHHHSCFTSATPCLLLSPVPTRPDAYLNAPALLREQRNMLTVLLFVQAQARKQWLEEEDRSSDGGGGAAPRTGTRLEAFRVVAAVGGGDDGGEGGGGSDSDETVSWSDAGTEGAEEVEVRGRGCLGCLLSDG